MLQTKTQIIPTRKASACNVLICFDDLRAQGKGQGRESGDQGQGQGL